MTPESSTPAEDPLLLDSDALGALASQPVVRRGLLYFKESRVIDLQYEVGRELLASVEGTREDLPYTVEVWVDEDREICVSCDCPYDTEPACKHAVASLLAYAARQPVPVAHVETAAGQAVAERARRGRSEISARHVDGDRWCGTWRASSLLGGTYQVGLLSVGARINTCTCPDHRQNRLGTCKHIEAVLHRLRTRAPKKFARLAETGVSRPVVHVDWSGGAAPTVRLRMPADRAAPPASLQRWFAAGDLSFRGRLPDDLAALRQAVEQAGGIVGPDVPQLSDHLAADAARAQRSRRIRVGLDGTAGRLSGVQARLYPYQVEGVAFLAGHGRALLADDMGLGKTLQAICATVLLQQEEGVRTTLVVCPASLKHQWAREIQRFTGQEAVVVQGTRDVRAGLYALRKPFTIANYELVLRDASTIQQQLAPDLLILDEAQRIKNWRTKTAAAVKGLQTRFAFVLTGTPLENRLEDHYSLMQVVDPRVLGPLWSFTLEFHVIDPRGRVLGYRNLSELRQRLAPVMLRRDRAIVANQLPARIDHQRDVELDKKQRTLHDDAISAASRLAAIMRRRPLTPSEEHRLMAALQKARMSCDAAGLVDRETQGSPKLDELRSLLGDLCVDGDHKVVIFTEWERMSRMAAEVAQDLGLGVVRLHGGVPTAKRGALIHRFEQDPLARVFISTDAGATGLNLQCASALVNLDLPWNPAVLDQRIARIHRLGQDRSVQVFVLVSRNSYEERVASLVAGKRQLFDNTIDPSGTEDAVGLSKKMVDLAAELLGTDSEPAEPGSNPSEQVEPLALPTPDAPPDSAPGPAGSPTTDLSQLVARIEAALPGRIERLVARGGGLMVVVDRVDADTQVVGEALGGPVPVVVVDPLTWACLVRLDPALGSAPLVGSAQTPTAERPPAVRRADEVKRKLRAASILLAQDLVPEALGMVVDGLLLAVCADGETPPERGVAAVWLYGTALPAGRVSAEDAAVVARALALAQASGVPGELVSGLIEEARRVGG